MVRLFRFSAALGVAAIALFGCGAEGSSDETTTTTAAEERPAQVQRMHLTLDGEPGPEAAGLLTAYELDYFDEAGIELIVTDPISPDRPTSYVRSELVDLGISHQPELALTEERGLPLVAIGSLVSEATLSMIWPEKSKIDGIADLKGKTIAYPGVPFQEELLGAVLAQEGLELSDVKLEIAGYDLVPELLSGRADAIFGGSWNVEGVALESRGLKPVVTRAEDMGIPPYEELVVIAQEDRVAEDPAVFRRFMDAVRRGTAKAIEDPETAAEAIYNASFGTANPKLTKAGLEATLPLLSESGEIDQEQETQLVDWMREQGLVSAG